MTKNAALRLVDTRTLDRQQWLAVRQGGIGSSDAAAAVGLCPYKSQLELWMEKTGRTPIEDAPPGMDDPRYWGTLLEPYVAVAYSQQTNRKVRKVNAVLQHPSCPYMLANLGREVVGCPDVQILECKTAGESLLVESDAEESAGPKPYPCAVSNDPVDCSVSLYSPPRWLQSRQVPRSFTSRQGRGSRKRNQRGCNVARAFDQSQR